LNIFYLDSNLEKCSEYHCNKHVISQLKEYTQLLSTAVRESGIDAGYKTTHKNHPSAIWARESLDNWLWLRDLVVALNNEFVYRYEKTVNHKSYEMAMTLPIPNIQSLGLTKFRLAMPDDVKQDDPIEAYRAYYKKHKSHMANWKNRDIPEWYK
jgi:hypothetical protein